MSDASATTIGSARQSLLEAKLGTLLAWQVPEIVPTIGPFDTGVFEAYDRKRRQFIEECEGRLREYTKEQVIKAATNDEPGALADWHEFKRDEISNFRSKAPPWYAGGFGHPEHVADFGYWAKMPHFSMGELLCLSVGVEPKYFDADRLKRLHASKSPDLWPTLQFLLRRHDQLQRKFGGTRHGDRVAPVGYLNWAEQVEFDMHTDFHALLKQYHQSDPSARSIDNSKADKRETDKMAQVITAMTIDFYGYRPEQSRSPIPTQLADLAAGMGLSISVDTIRKYLKRGATFLPKD